MRSPLRTTAALTSRDSVSQTSFLLTLEVGGGFPTAKPGQFVSVEAAPELTLPRPFAVAGRPDAGSMELLVEVRGRGTRALVERPIGSAVGLMGPLGNGFTPPPVGAFPVLAAGGIGVAGLRLFAQEIAAGGGRLMALVGARESGLLLDGCMPGMTADGRIEIRVATDDGSAGFHGPVTALLSQTLTEIRRRGSGTPFIYCCGPPAMIRSTSRIAMEQSVPCEALLEEKMACGVGACRGCVVETRSGYRCVCSDGPVFDVRELVFEEQFIA